MTVPVREMTFRYRNWRGEVAERRVLPSSIWFGVTSYHPEPQWLMSAIDIERWEMRDFAMKDMTEVRYK